MLSWTPSHGRAKIGRPARTYIQQLCANTGCSPENLPETIDDREGWRERVRDIHADGTPWRWWPFSWNKTSTKNDVCKHIFLIFAPMNKFSHFSRAICSNIIKRIRFKYCWLKRNNLKPIKSQKKCFGQTQNILLLLSNNFSRFYF